MRSFIENLEIFNGGSVMQAAFTATAATDLITSNAHGLQSGDMVWVSTTTTLPAGLSASTTYYVINPTTNTFQLSATKDGTAVNITSAGTGTHTFSLKGKPQLVSDFKHITLLLATTGSCNCTIKFQGSFAVTMPDFSAAASLSNPWDYVQLKNYQAAATVAGDTGVVFAGTDSVESLEFNTNGLTWVCANLTAWSAGKVKLLLNAYNE